MGNGGYVLQLTGWASGGPGEYTIKVDGLGVTLEGKTKEAIDSELKDIIALIRRYADAQGADVFENILERRNIQATKVERRNIQVTKVTEGSSAPFRTEVLV